MRFGWPSGFVRVPDEDWARAPVESLAAKYDRVDRHGWYANLDPTVEELRGLLRPGDVLLDYSGGTGILIGRLLDAVPNADFGIVNVDSSPKFLRLAFEKFREDERIAFRLIAFLKERHRLEYVDEVLGKPLVERGVNVLTSTNAIHLYLDLDETLASWRRVVRPGGRVLVQSGNIRAPDLGAGRWIIDDTVEAVQEEAARLVREEARFAGFRGVIGDAARMAAHTKVRRKFFPAVRPLAAYVEALETAGFEVLRVATRPIAASTADWIQFLSVYHEGVLGWAGGTERVEGRAPDEASVRLRLLLLDAAMRRVLGGRDRFEAAWTYVTCAPR